MEESFIIQTDSFQLTQMDFFVRMLVATGIGFVIGLEREHAAIVDKEDTFAGIRTFILVALMGFLTALLSLFFTPWILVGGLAGVSGLVAVSYWITAQKGEIGSTTEFATIFVFLLGSTTLIGYVEASLALTVILVILLSLKVKLRSVIGRITQAELYAFIQFVTLALLIFPFLPDKIIGPFSVFNPRELGWVVILTSGLGFVGYMLMKFLGSDKGILLTGILGGLVSSTVVAWVFSKKSKAVPALSAHCAVAILAASTLMVLRVLVWIIIFNQTLLPRLILPISLIFLTGLGTVIFFYRQQQVLSTGETDFPLGKPLNLRGAIFFGVLYTSILLVVSYANEQFGAQGIFISSAIAALTDIDAITISVAKLAGETIPLLTAENAILLAILCNTIVKIGISLWAGSRNLRKYVLIGYGLIFIAGLIGFGILNA
ncbi:MAG: MgtC/SapB family protein [Saprospiraceae bacterium]